jgi:hypothetical protein
MTTSMIIIALTVIGLVTWLWIVPMRNLYKKAIEDGEAHITLSIWSCFVVPFTGVIVCILMLCSSGNTK